MRDFSLDLFKKIIIHSLPIYWGFDVMLSQHVSEG